MLEANPRASRTVPFVAKATGVPLAKVAARVMLGGTLAELRDEGPPEQPVDRGHVAVKEAVLPFNRFPEVDTVLGPEMRSTGEVMGIDASFELAFGKSQTAAGNPLPRVGTVFFSLTDRDKEAGRPVARLFADLGLGDRGHRRARADVPGGRSACPGRSGSVARRPRPRGRRGAADGCGQDRPRRQHAAGQRLRVPTATRSAGAATVHKVELPDDGAGGPGCGEGLAERRRHPLKVRSLQEFHARSTRTERPRARGWGSEPWTSPPAVGPGSCPTR